MCSREKHTVAKLQKLPTSCWTLHSTHRLGQIILLEKSQKIFEQNISIWTHSDGPEEEMRI